MKVYPILQKAALIIFYIALQFSFTSIPPNILLKTFLSIVVSRLAISLFSIQHSAPYVATGLINLLHIFIRIFYFTLFFILFVFFIFIYLFILFVYFIFIYLFFSLTTDRLFTQHQSQHL